MVPSTSSLALKTQQSKKQLQQSCETFGSLGLLGGWDHNSYSLLANPSVGSGEVAYLDDTVIHSCQLLLKKRFPFIQGFQHPTSWKALGFTSIDPSKPFIQISHDVNWVVFCNILGNINNCTTDIYVSTL